MLVAKTMAAADGVGAETVCLGGGVAANSRLREGSWPPAGRPARRGYVPSLAMCTDNAAMVAAAGWCASTATAPAGPRRRRQIPASAWS